MQTQMNVFCFKENPYEEIVEWFSQIASQLLKATRLVVCGKPHRLVELEFYYYNEVHPDPFAHRHPLQLT